MNKRFLVNNDRGQATTEIVLLLPIFLLLAAGMVMLGYIALQGLKVQEAANLAARIQGQERVSGGTSRQSILQDNGLDGAVEKVPTKEDLAQLKHNPNGLSGFKAAPNGGVYGKYYRAVHAMFSPGEQKKLFVPPPIKEGTNTDTIRIVRVLNPPKIFGFKLKPIRLEATAYGGEDSHMYSLPRWGRSGSGGPNAQPFYHGQIKERAD